MIGLGQLNFDEMMKTDAGRKLRDQFHSQIEQNGKSVDTWQKVFVEKRVPTADTFYKILKKVFSDEFMDLVSSEGKFKVRSG